MKCASCKSEMDCLGLGRRGDFGGIERVEYFCSNCKTIIAKKPKILVLDDGDKDGEQRT